LKGRGKRPASFPAVFLDETQILEQAPFLRRVLQAHGVSDVDLPDVIQEILLGAWRSMMAGRFRPDPRFPLAESFRAWLVGIAWRQASHYRERAYRRHEVPWGLGWDLRLDPRPSPEEALETLEILREIWRLPRAYREILALVTVGATLAEITEQLGIPIGTVASRRRRAWSLLRRALKRCR